VIDSISFFFKYSSIYRIKFYNKDRV